MLLVRLAFSTMVQFCTGFPVPSLSTPENFYCHTFSTNKKARSSDATGFRTV
ncbi:Hypothetical protein WLH_00013 [Escherichia coli O25b:H4]|uniref:Uncharacterized protein n=1 Tax=Escherichia coli O25b:H4 TaxID=941280 RepID=A0A192C6P3_ECO25|nr:Hypothetical protein WLH_00013 [Escherichia coli O25b:H4]